MNLSACAPRHRPACDHTVTRPSWAEGGQGAALWAFSARKVPFVPTLCFPEAGILQYRRLLRPLSVVSHWEATENSEVRSPRQGL